MISVIVPSLNEADTIKSCLRSIASQSIKRDRYEIIVVDGGSKDNTQEIAVKYADVVLKQNDPGIGGARRDGARYAKGEILAFTDADTIVSPGWLEAIEKNITDYDCSTGPVIYTNRDFKSDILTRWRDLYRVFNSLNFYYIIGANMAVKSDVYWKAKGHSDISLLDDYDLSLKLYHIGAKGVYDEDQAVYTSSRRVERLLTYALTVAYGHYHYSISRERDKLLNYPRPEDMTLKSLLKDNVKGVETLSNLTAVHKAIEKSLRRRIH